MYVRSTYVVRITEYVLYILQLDDADRPFEDGGLASTSFAGISFSGQINRDKLLPYVRPSVIVQPSSRNQTITSQIRILAVTMHTSGSEVAVFVHPIH